MSRVFVTPGDPRGIGPEVVAAALRADGDDPRAEVVGPDGPLGEAELEDLVRRPGAYRSDAEAGAFAARAIERAVELACARGRAAIVTGPVHKPSLHAAGWAVPGQSEMLGRLAGVEQVGMLMAAESTRLGGPLRVLLATTHLPLRAVPDAVTTELLTRQIGLLYTALRRDWSIDAPRIALCGLNPHASDGGLFGSEEEEVMEPAVLAVRREGIPAFGPIPADTAFTLALAGSFDAVVAPYHDVGMAAFKTAAFGRGVNVTLGLPFVRTSPDHGTAFDIVGTGRADPGSMLEAIRLARRLAHNRFDTPSADV